MDDRTRAHATHRYAAHRPPRHPAGHRRMCRLPRLAARSLGERATHQKRRRILGARLSCEGLAGGSDHGVSAGLNPPVPTNRSGWSSITPTRTASSRDHCLSTSPTTVHGAASRRALSPRDGCRRPESVRSKPPATSNSVAGVDIALRPVESSRCDDPKSRTAPPSASALLAEPQREVAALLTRIAMLQPRRVGGDPQRDKPLPRDLGDC